MNYNLRSTTTTPSSWKGKHRLLRLALEVQLEKVRSLQFGGHHPELEYSVEEQISEILLLLSQYSEKAIHMAMIKTIGRRGDPEYTGRCPLHLACDTNAPFQVIHILLQMEPTRTAILHRDKWEDLPLHTACSRKDYTEVVELLLQYDNSKRSVITKRYDGSLPIHTACRYVIWTSGLITTGGGWFLFFSSCDVGMTPILWISIFIFSAYSVSFWVLQV